MYGLFETKGLRKWLKATVAFSFLILLVDLCISQCIQGAATDGSGGKGRQKRRRSLRKSKHAGQQLRHELMAQTQSPDGNVEARTGLAAIDENYSLSGMVVVVHGTNTRVDFKLCS